MRTVFKIVINPNAPNPRPALLARRDGEVDWRAVYFEGLDLNLCEERVGDAALLGMKVLGSWEERHHGRAA